MLLDTFGSQYSAPHSAPKCRLSSIYYRVESIFAQFHGGVSGCWKFSNWHLFFFWFFEGIVVGAFWKPLGVLGRPLGFLVSFRNALGAIWRSGGRFGSSCAPWVPFGVPVGSWGVFNVILCGVRIC